MAVESLTLPPAQRVRRWRTYLAVWRFHRLLGLAASLVLVVLSLSGSLLVIHHELEAIFERELHHVSPPPNPAATAPALADLAREIAPLAPPDYRLFRIHPSATPGATHQFVFASPTRERWSAFVAPATGAVIWHGDDQSLFTSWLLHLHMQLHAGRVGYYITGIAGLALMLLGASGLYLYRDRLSALWRHPFRLRLGWRVALADLHKWTGVACLYFVFVLGLTGALYVLSILRAPAAPPPPADPFDLATLAPIEPMLAAAQARLPGTEIIRAQFPAQAGGPVTLLLLHRTAPVWQKFSRIQFDATTGELRDVRAAHAAPASAQFSAMLAPLHFGFYGATWVKWAYFFGGLSPTVLAVTGLLLWTRRQRAAAHPTAQLSHAAL